MLAGCAPNQQPADAALLTIGGGSIHIRIDGHLSLPQPVVVEWVHRAAVAVTTYLGRFPVRQVTVTVHAGGWEPIGNGITFGGSTINVRLGRSVRQADLDQDWVMTHEMFHLAFPTLDRRYLWMMEGLSDYLEPIARARAGQWSAQDAWREFVDGLPRGMPQPGEGGLDDSASRERIYWGGNIYWLLADVTIRDQTDNRHSVDDAIRAILLGGGNGSAEWPLERVLRVSDAATGTTALSDLYNQLGRAPGNVDLDSLWRKLGVRHSGDSITFDNDAPWARIRQAITARAQTNP